MGEMADYIIEQGEMARDLHDVGLCDGYCQLCYEEMSLEERKAFDDLFKDIGDL